MVRHAGTVLEEDGGSSSKQRSMVEPRAGIGYILYCYQIHLLVTPSVPISEKWMKWCDTAHSHETRDTWLPWDKCNKSRLSVRHDIIYCQDGVLSRETSHRVPAKCHTPFHQGFNYRLHPQNSRRSYTVMPCRDRCDVRSTELMHSLSRAASGELDRKEGSMLSNSTARTSSTTIDAGVSHARQRSHNSRNTPYPARLLLVHSSSSSRAPQIEYTAALHARLPN